MKDKLPENIDALEDMYKVLDEYEEAPPPRVLDNIQSDLGAQETPVRKLNSAVYWKVAAALLVLVGLSWWFFFNGANDNGDSRELANPAPDKEMIDSAGKKIPKTAE